MNKLKRRVKENFAAVVILEQIQFIVNINADPKFVVTRRLAYMFNVAIIFIIIFLKYLDSANSRFSK